MAVGLASRLISTRMNLLPLAYTKLKAFEMCPRQARARYITKEYPFVETEAMRDGKDYHEMFDRRIKDDLPFSDVYSWCEQFVPTRSGGTDVLESEVSLGIDSENNGCSFYDATCFFRGKIDCLNIEGDTAFIIDWKTGKPYEDPDELNLHAMLVKAVYPHIKHWRGLYVWLRERKVGELHILSPARTYFQLLKRVENLQLEDIPKRNPFCKAHCELTGCEFNGIRR